MATANPPTRPGIPLPVRPARHAIYVWQWPVRIVHWTIVICLLGLSFTGYYVDHPFFSGGGGPGHARFTMGTIRFIHEMLGFTFIAAVLFRIYWAFVGNRYAHWRALLPVTKTQRRELRETVAFYAFRRVHIPRTNGHNQLAGMAYVFLYIGFILTALTGADRRVLRSRAIPRASRRLGRPPDRGRRARLRRSGRRADRRLGADPRRLRDLASRRAGGARDAAAA